MRIGYIFDEGFTFPAFVSIYSLLVNNRHLNDLKFTIFDDGINEESKIKLNTMISEFDSEVEYIDVKLVRDKLAQITSFNWNGSYSTYIRLMLNSLLPNCDDTIIMIDADTIIDGKIDELINIDLEDKVCAMALDAIPLKYHKYSRLGMNELINGGLLVIDLKKWRTEKAEKKILYFLSNLRSKNMLTDEDVLSLIFKNKIKRIPPHLNYLTQYYLFSNKFYYHFFGWDRLYQAGVFYSLSELYNSNSNAIIYHCIDTYTNRPWFKNNIHPYTYLFDKYLLQSPLNSYSKSVRKMKISNSIEYYLRKILPNKQSKFMYAVALKLYYGIGAKWFYKR